MHKPRATSTLKANIMLLSVIVISSLFSNLVTFGQYTILFEVIVLFYFYLLAPQALSFWALILYGLLKDWLCLATFGYHAVLFTSFRLILESQEIELESSSPLSLCIRFSLSLLAVFILQDLLMTIVMRYNFYGLLQGFAHQWAITVVAYIIFYYIFRRNIKFLVNTND